MQSLELGITTKYNDVINLVQQGKSDEAFNILFETWNVHYKRAISGVFKDESEYKYHFEANAAKMAAYKASKAKEILMDCLKEKPEKYIANARAVLRKFNGWQRTEYNTIVSRCRTAKQWEKFKEKKDNDPYPNLKWLPTRSAYPRDEHQKLVGLTLPKNHPFWKENQPGNLWGCKCDWIETDEPMNAKSLDVNNVKIQAKGLEGNPGEIRRAFTDSHPYFTKANTQSKKILDKFLSNHILTQFKKEDSYLIHPLVIIEDRKRLKNEAKKKATREMKNTQKKDLPELIRIAKIEADKGKKVYVLPKLHRDSDLYKYIYKSRNAYENKCPGFMINGVFYEYESYEDNFSINTLSNMMSRGFKQAKNIIIDGSRKRIGIADVKNKVSDFLESETFKGEILSVWIFDGNDVFKAYP